MRLYRFECSDCDAIGETSADKGAAVLEMLGHRCYEEDEDFDPKSILTPERRAELFPSLEKLQTDAPELTDKGTSRAKIALGCRLIDFGIEAGCMVICTCGMSHLITDRTTSQYVYDAHIRVCDGTPGAHERRRKVARTGADPMAQSA